MEDSTVIDYLTLRKQGVIGRVWNDPQTHTGWLLAPVDALPGFEYQVAQPVSDKELTGIVDGLMGREMVVVERKPVGRERAMGITKREREVA